MFLCECKYRSEPVDSRTLAALIRRSKLVKTDLPKELMVFSRSGYTQDAVDAAQTEGIALRTLEDVSDPTSPRQDGSDP